MIKFDYEGADDSSALIQIQEASTRKSFHLNHMPVASNAHSKGRLHEVAIYRTL